MLWLCHVEHEIMEWRCLPAFREIKIVNRIWSLWHFLTVKCVSTHAYRWILVNHSQKQDIKKVTSLENSAKIHDMSKESIFRWHSIGYDAQPLICGFELSCCRVCLCRENAWLRCCLLERLHVYFAVLAQSRRNMKLLVSEWRSCFRGIQFFFTEYFY